MFVTLAAVETCGPFWFAGLGRLAAEAVTKPRRGSSLSGMWVGIVGAALCVLAGAFMIAGLAVDLDSTEAKALMVGAAVLFVPGALLAFVWMRVRMGPPS